MFPRTRDEKHLVPLLDFIRYVSYQGRRQRLRLPKRINGSQLKMKDLGQLPQQDTELSLAAIFSTAGSSRSESVKDTTPEDSLVGDELSGLEAAVLAPDPVSFSTPASASPHATPPLTPAVARKRSRSESPVGIPEPLQYEFLSHPVNSKGSSLIASYIDIKFVGCTLVAEDDEKLKKIMGRACCYLLLGTSVVVTGVVVGADPRLGQIQISPDRGCSAPMEWVHADRVYNIPADLPRLKVFVANEMRKALDALAS